MAPCSSSSPVLAVGPSWQVKHGDSCRGVAWCRDGSKVHHHKHADDAGREHHSGEQAIYDLINLVVLLLTLHDTRQGTKGYLSAPYGIPLGKETFRQLL